jgi:hypothetical protein
LTPARDDATVVLSRAALDDDTDRSADVRRCANETCKRPLVAMRAHAIYCGGACRAEASRRRRAQAASFAEGGSAVHPPSRKRTEAHSGAVLGHHDLGARVDRGRRGRALVASLREMLATFGTRRKLHAQRTSTK